MKDSITIWNRRFGLFWKEAAGYLRYVFNSGFLVFLMFTFIAGGYYYSAFVSNIPKQFPIEWFIVSIISFVISVGSVRTFVQDADLVFLLPMEWKMSAYFRKSFIYSLLIKIFGVLFVLALLQPLYAHRFEGSGILSGIGIAAIILCLLNLYASWVEQRLHHRSERRMHFIVRLTMTYIVLFLYVRDATSIIFVVAVVVLLLTIPYYLKLRKNNIHWTLLVEVEKNKLFRFYNIVNLFVDVPHLQNRIKERKWLPSFTRWLPFEKRFTYYYLYIKSISRSNELLDMVIRLTIFSIFFMLMASKYTIGQWFIIVATLVMASVQLSTLRKHHEYSIWLMLYPLSQKDKVKALQHIRMLVLLCQAVVLSLIAGINKESYLTTFGITLLFSLVTALFFNTIIDMKQKKKAVTLS